jgi:hypothetical protein
MIPEKELAAERDREVRSEVRRLQRDARRNAKFGSIYPKSIEGYAAKLGNKNLREYTNLRRRKTKGRKGQREGFQTETYRTLYFCPGM